MKFQLSTSKNFYSEDDGDALRVLVGLGFKFKATSDGRREIIPPYPEIEINSLERLIEFAREHEPIILSFSGETCELEIYNDYRE